MMLFSQAFSVGFERFQNSRNSMNTPRTPALTQDVTQVKVIIRGTQIPLELAIPVEEWKIKRYERKVDVTTTTVVHTYDKYVDIQSFKMNAHLITSCRSTGCIHLFHIK